MTTSVAEAIHAATLNSPRPISNNAEMLDKAAPETTATVSVKRALIEACQKFMGEVRSYRRGLGPIQASLIGKLAELLLLKPTNKELAEAMSETWDPSYHGPEIPVTTIQVGEGREPYTDVPKTKPNPYAQQVRRYKILAQIEAGITPLDSNEAPVWDLDLVKNGLTINSVHYASPVAALVSGVVTMEAVFVAWTNVLQPKVVDLHKWSTSHVDEARKSAATVRVTVRTFNKKMKREQKVSVVAVKSPSCLYGLILGLLTHEPKEGDEPIYFGRERADRMIAAINAKVPASDKATPVPATEAK